MNKNIELTQEIVRELLDYNPETGFLYWKKRNIKWFEDGKVSAKNRQTAWNNRHSGKEAFYTLREDGYKQGYLFYIPYLTHRIIWLYMTGEWPENDVGHNNHIRSDNRFENLNAETRIENLRNQSIRTNNKTGVIGVCWNKSINKWMSTITVEGRSIYLGSSEDFEYMIKLRKEAELKYGFHENHGK